MATIDYFNPNDLKQVRDLCSEWLAYPMPLAGVNEEGEDTLTTVCSEFIFVKTYQSNGLVRKNYYYTDGAVEELFERK